MKRPRWVAKDFAGACKVFPKEDKLLLPFQGKWATDKSRLKIAEKSRQIGWTWSEALCVVRNKSQADATLDHWISSRDDIQARLFLEDCKAFAGLLQIAARDLGEMVIDDERKLSAYVLAFANGLRAHSMSSNPDAQAGKRGGRTLDEFALHKDPRKLYSIAYPGITWGGSMSIFSTHRGTANFFNQLIIEIVHKGNPKGFSHHRVTLQDALDQGFLYKLQTKLPLDDPRQAMDEAEYFTFIKAGSADDESFAEEYMCIPSDDASAFLSYELIDGCKYPAGEAWETDLLDCKNPLYVGVDVGRTKDLTVIKVVELVGGVHFVRAMIEMQNVEFSTQEATLYPILALPQVRRACIDSSGLGRQFAERARQRFGAKVEGVTFTGPVKEELAYPLKAAFEDRSIRIPDNKFLIADLRSIRKETTASGNTRFAGERTSNGHSDRFWALALALHAAKPSAAQFYAEVIS
jgi:phage FluMu gp28-like protein